MFRNLLTAFLATGLLLAFAAGSPGSLVYGQTASGESPLAALVAKPRGEWPARPTSPTPPAGPVGELEGLLQLLKVPYAPVPEMQIPMFSVTLQQEDGPALEIMVAEMESDFEDKLGIVVSLVGTAWADQKVAVLEKIARANYFLALGKVGADDEGSVVFRSEFWLRTADPQVLSNHLAETYVATLVLREELEVVVGDEQEPSEPPRSLGERRSPKVSNKARQSLLESVRSSVVGTAPSRKLQPQK